ncbi:MAG: 3-deoxy-D-manno-octulosonic acid transferase [Parcubacteria group bacterium]|nr:3-deoxy-D-manno-octulosonic acid transferase [Parcubacteria group bacterium]|tara:strand:- start:856 stop:1593 length:738 start_codon:yes stop_codon:yes gene_type:complete
MEFSDYIIYVDESGDHNLQQTKSPYPIFSLAFCIFKKSDYTSEVVPRLQDLKFRWFGHDAFVLHEREVRKREKPFEILRTKEHNEKFMQEVGDLINNVPMTVIAAVINKDNHRTQYALPANPYELALRFCMERTARFMKEKNHEDKLTHIIVECRGANEDRDLELEFRRICDGQNLVGKLDYLDILFVDKKANSTGLQIADLFARPIGLKVLRPDQPNRAYDVIEQKFRRSNQGKIEGYGFKVFP